MWAPVAKLWQYNVDASATSQSSAIVWATRTSKVITDQYGSWGCCIPPVFFEAPVSFMLPVSYGTVFLVLKMFCFPPFKLKSQAQVAQSVRRWAHNAPLVAFCWPRAFPYFAIFLTPSALFLPISTRFWFPFSYRLLPKLVIMTSFYSQPIGFSEGEIPTSQPEIGWMYKTS